MLSKENIILIRVLRIEKNNDAKKIITEFPRKNWSLIFVNYLLRQIDSTGSADSDGNHLIEE